MFKVFYFKELRLGLGLGLLIDTCILEWHILVKYEFTLLVLSVLIWINQYFSAVTTNRPPAVSW